LTFAPSLMPSAFRSVGSISHVATFS